MGLEDVRGLLSSDVIPVVNNTQGYLRTQHRLDHDLQFRTELLYVHRNIGDTFRGSAGLDIRSDIGQTSLLAGIQTPVGQTNGFVPGGAHPSLLVGLGQTIVTDRNTDTPLVDLNVTYIQNLDDGDFSVNSGAVFHFE